ncbi:MAG: ABC transporter permease, partial [Gemmatimonadales bacterium]
MNAAPPGLSSLRIPRDEPASLPAGGHRHGWLIATTFVVVLVSTPISFVIESVILALFGGLIGCLMALPLNRIVTCTTNFSSFSELAFGFRVTPGILLTGLAVAAVMGLVGGFLPALKASRQPLAAALRAGGATRPHWAGGPHS